MQIWLAVRKSLYRPATETDRGETAICVGGYICIPNQATSPSFFAWLEPETMGFTAWEKVSEYLEAEHIQVVKTMKFEAEFERWKNDRRRSPGTTPY